MSLRLNIKPFAQISFKEWSSLNQISCGGVHIRAVTCLLSYHYNIKLAVFHPPKDVFGWDIGYKSSRIGQKCGLFGPSFNGN